MRKVYRKRIKKSQCHGVTRSVCDIMKKRCKTTRRGKRMSYCRKSRNIRRRRH